MKKLRQDRCSDKRMLRLKELNTLGLQELRILGLQELKILGLQEFRNEKWRNEGIKSRLLFCCNRNANLLAY